LSRQIETRMWVITISGGRGYNKDIIRNSILADTRTNEEHMESFVALAQHWRNQAVSKFTNVSTDKVIIPFNKALADFFTESVSVDPVARDVARFRKIIEISTKLHAALNPTSRARVIISPEHSYWVADPLDLSLAWEISGPIMASNYLRLNEAQVALFNACRELLDEADAEFEESKGSEGDKPAKCSDDGVKPGAICDRAGINKAWGGKMLRDMTEKGYLTPLKAMKGGRVSAYTTTVEKLPLVDGTAMEECLVHATAEARIWLTNNGFEDWEFAKFYSLDLPKKELPQVIAPKPVKPKSKPASKPMPKKGPLDNFKRDDPTPNNDF